MTMLVETSTPTGCTSQWLRLAAERVCGKTTASDAQTGPLLDRMLTNRTTSEGEAQDAWAKRAVSATVGHRAGTQRVPCADHKGTAAGRAHFVRCCVEARTRRSAA